MAVNKGGRPPALKPDEKTIATIRALGRIQCTTREAAAVLAVHHETFLQFKARYPEAAAAFANGAEEGKANLRRTQFKLAEHNVAMAIFLGKNLLGQTDKMVQENVGPTLTDEQLDTRISQLATALGIETGTAGGDAGTPPAASHH